MFNYSKIYPTDYIICVICKKQVLLSKNFIKCKKCNIFMHYESCGYIYQEFIQERIRNCPHCESTDTLQTTINNNFYWVFLQR